MTNNQICVICSVPITSRTKGAKYHFQCTKTIKRVRIPTTIHTKIAKAAKKQKLYIMEFVQDCLMRNIKSVSKIQDLSDTKNNNKIIYIYNSLVIELKTQALKLGTTMQNLVANIFNQVL